MRPLIPWGRKWKSQGYLNLIQVIMICQKCITCMTSAFGCLNPSPPAHGFVERNGTQARFSCYESSDSGENSWEITCFEGMWQGEVGNCSAGKCNRWSKFTKGLTSFKSNMSQSDINFFHAYIYIYVSNDNEELMYCAIILLLTQSK